MSDVATELIPARATFLPGLPVEVEVRGMPESGEVVVSHLGDPIRTVPYAGEEVIELEGLPEGCYRFELVSDANTTHTAVEVSSDPFRRLRYGFVVDYSPRRDAAAVEDTVRRFHLNAVQFYDWAFRHADLLGSGEDYRDPLGRDVSLTTLRNLVRSVRASGSNALGYAAVYAVGREEWPRWQHDALIDPGGEVYSLDDFLFLVDPGSDDWLTHLTVDLAKATDVIGFDGFHLDQYGYPKLASRRDGAVVDLARSFVTTIEAVRDRLPDSRLVFNNVNDFPTAETARASQDALYIEPWDPHLTLGALAGAATSARAVADGKPVVFAAYQSVYLTGPTAAADRATALTMATLFSHGATQLLVGEEGRILVDPYYPRNHVMERSTWSMLKRWYDFLVELDSVLLEPGWVDVTSSFAGPHNDDCDVTFESAQVTETPAAGSVWRRITRIGTRFVVHLINLVGQEDTLWDAPRRVYGSPGEGVLRFRRVQGQRPRVRVADPDTTADVVDLEAAPEGDHAVARLPRLGAWMVIIIDLLADGGD